MTDTKKYEVYMREALKEAEKAFNQDEVPIGAVIVHNDRIIARAHNESIKKNDPSAHAEITAIRRAGRFLENYRLNKAKLYSTIEPCIMCAGAAVWARIDTIIFGAEDMKAGACGSVLSLHNSRLLNHRIKIVRGIMEKECRNIMQTFFKNKRQ